MHFMPIDSISAVMNVLRKLTELFRAVFCNTLVHSDLHTHTLFFCEFLPICLCLGLFFCLFICLVVVSWLVSTAATYFVKVRL